MPGNSVNGAGKSNSIRCRITRMNDYENERGGRVAPSDLYVRKLEITYLSICEFSRIQRGSIVIFFERILLKSLTTFSEKYSMILSDGDLLQRFL